MRGGRRAARSSGRVLAALAAVSFAGLGLATSAWAAPTVAISVGPDPTESITTQLGVTGEGVEGANDLEMTVKPTGGEGCGANRSADRGQTVVNSSESGHRTVTENWTFETAGSYLVCAWLMEFSSGESKVLATNSATVAVRPPHLSIALGAPPVVRPKQTFQIATTAQAETRRTIYEYIVPNTGRGCAANAQAAAETPGEIHVDFPKQFGDWSLIGGPFTETSNIELQTVGSYLSCAYFEYPNSSTPPEMTALVAFAVVKPPPPCLVPHPTRHTTLGSIERRLLSAHCKIGKVRSASSSHVPRGIVIALSPAPGSHRANGSAVNILVSKGRPHRHRH